MYPVSNTFKEYIKKKTVTFEWHGTIVDKDENEYELKPLNFARNSGKITRKCSGEKLEIGTTCASELQVNLYLDVDRYTLIGGVITLDFTLYEGVDGNDDPVTEDVPMGIYTISESNQSNGQLSLIAYDNMTKFDDVSFNLATHNDIQLPYLWLVDACEACGITLGNTSAQIQNMPNGRRNIGFTDVAADVTSWRDILGKLATVLGGFAYIGRDGKLYIKQYTSASIDTISSSFRYKSDLSDYRTTYMGIHNVCRLNGVQEYVENENEDGLVLDIGTNPFLQFTRENARLKALQEIIDAWNGVYYVPFEVSMPIVPYYDPGDVVTFTDNQAAEYDYGAITEMVISIGGKMTIRCSGDDPRLENAQDKFSKTVEGISNDYSNTRNPGSNDFWMLHITNTEQLSVGSTEVQVAEIEWTQKTVFQDIEMILLIDAEISATATVTLRLNVDDEEDYEVVVVTDKSLKGTRPFHGSNPQKIYGKGLHTAKVYMTVTDTPMLVGDLL